MASSHGTVFVPEPIHPEAIRRLREKAEVILRDSPDADSWREKADAVIVRGYPITADELARCARLKVVGKHGIGVDNIDVAAARKAGVRVVYTPLANAESVAELAVAFMLAMSRNLCCGLQAMKTGKTLPAQQLIGVEMRGKTLGVVGMGRIGRLVAGMLRSAFAMEILAFDPFLPEAAWAELPVPARRCETVEELVAGSDYVTVHVPLTDATRNLIGAAQFARFRPGAMLVNTARGGVIDEEALCLALKRGKLRFAASDVYVKEPPPPDHPLLALDNFIGMPHVAGNTEEALFRMGTTVVRDVLKVLNGEEPEFDVP